MYSVIIMTTESMENYLRYQNVFRKAEREGHVGFVTWQQEGRTLDEALPGLRALTDDKKEWRAIIVQPEGSGKQNPYDLVTKEEDAASESEFPLIRLVHMLGSVPTPEKEFKAVLLEEPHMEPRMIYEPVSDPEQERAFRALQAKYAYDGVRPATIFLITTREPWRDPEDISSDLIRHQESESSQFWRKNRYPAICRFLVFDMLKQGPIREQADYFRFWLAVRLISTNKIDPATVQAYRLYRTDLEFDFPVMEDNFQQMVERLASVRYYVEGSIHQEMRGLSAGMEELPDYKMDISVAYETPKDNKSSIKNRNFKLIGRGASKEIAFWEQEKEQIEKQILKNVRAADRALDQTASRMKDHYTISEKKSILLDRYQKEDLINETEDLYRDIIRLQGGLPGNNDLTGKAEKESDDVIRELRRRISAGPVMATIAIGLLVSIGMYLPAIVQLARRELVSTPAVIGGMLLPIVLMSICGLVVLLTQRAHLRGLISIFNSKIASASSQLDSNADHYSNYLEAVLSHSRGRSLLDMSERIEEKRGKLRNNKYLHIDAVEESLKMLSSWSNAFHLQVDYDEPQVYELADFDVRIPPVDNPIYDLEGKQDCEIEVNRSGMEIAAPFEFIKRLELSREELYDDDNQ